MSRRFGGRDPFGKDHDHARELAAARLAEPLHPDDAEWLEAHLAWCAPCRAVAAEYETQRLALRAFRLDQPLPPRDLWARTAAAIDADRSVRPVRGRTTTAGRVRGRQPFPVAPLAALLVVAIAVGASLLNGAPILLPAATAGPSSAASPFATPIAVAAREVPLVRRTADGTLVLQVGRINQVCPLDVPSCGQTTVERTEVGRIAAHEATDVLLSPTRSHLVVLDRDGKDGGVYVVAVSDLPAPLPSPTPRRGPDSSPDRTPSPTSTATAVPSPTPPATRAPSSARPPATPSEEPAASPTPTVPPAKPVATPSSAATPPVATAEPTPTTSAPPETAAPTPAAPTPSASVAVSPGPDGVLRIAGDVVLVGPIAGYSSDGNAFAFTARPADGSTGPDVYLWRTGDAEAHPVTDDHDAVFADWLGTSILVSRPAPNDAGAAGTVTTLLDPATGSEVPVDATGMWRPTVDPIARTAVWWQGTVARSEDGFGWEPAGGRLVIAAWPGVVADPQATATPASSEEPASAVPVKPEVLVDGPVRDWQVRWDETGTRLAVWIADRDDPERGLLSLYLIDPTTGTIATGAPLLQDAPAKEGFSLGSGRLAWSRETPDGESQVEVLAWSQDTVGQVVLAPGGELVVVR